MFFDFALLLVVLFSLLLAILINLPLVLLARRSGRPLSGLAAGIAWVIGCVVTLIMGLSAIRHSTSSTAVLGYYTLPIGCVVVSTLLAYNVWAVVFILQLCIERLQRVAIDKATSVRATIALLVLVGTASGAGYFYHRNRLLESVSVATESELPLLFERARSRSDWELMAAIAGSRRLTAQLAHDVYLATEQQNGVDAYPVLLALAMNKRTPRELLKLLAISDSASVRYRVAAHPNATKELLRKLRDDTDREVRVKAVENWREHDYGIDP